MPVRDAVGLASAVEAWCAHSATWGNMMQYEYSPDCIFLDAEDPVRGVWSPICRLTCGWLQCCQAEGRTQDSIGQRAGGVERLLKSSQQSAR